MIPEEVKRRAMAEARKANVSFADFVRQAIVEKLPRSRRTLDPLKRRRADPLFRLLDQLPAVAAATPTDVAVRHDDYLYGEGALTGKRRA
jgi:hypothetical protein